MQVEEPPGQPHPLAWLPPHPAHGIPDSPAWRGASHSRVVLLSQSPNPCSCREGGEASRLVLFFLPFPTRVNLFSSLTCEPKEFSASDNGKLFELGMREVERREAGENVWEVGLAGEIKIPNFGLENRADGGRREVKLRQKSLCQPFF